ncbi:MAG: hypothetical protein WD295_01010, partial [Bacteroidota bacterium]
MALDLLEQILPHVKAHIYPSAVPLNNWKIKETDAPENALPSLNDKSWGDFRIPSFWGGYDRIAWFRGEAVIPADYAGKPVVLVFEIPDALVFINGKPFQGLNAYHREVFLTDRGRTNQAFALAIQAYSGRSREVSTFDRADL